MLVAKKTRKGDCMMESIVKEKLVSFKSLEQKVFVFVCETAREITRIILENYDDELAAGRDRSLYRDKGKRTTTIKTVYGEVTYARRVYQTKLPDGEKVFIYLLDEARNPREAGRKPANDPHMAESVCRFHADGKTIREIAQLVNCSVGHVHKLIHEHEAGLKK
ncbi:MAG: UPF0236 family protein [Clostridiales bacterium]|nr:UPF0236 family protein [Clostridiales bacterium]